MPDDLRERYLADLDRLLPMPPERRAEVVEEIGTHLDDAVGAAIERGMPADRAEADAQARLGAPPDLARDLARPEQSGRRLLAAVGAGVRTGAGQWLYGYLLGALLVYLAFMATVAVGMIGARILDVDWNLQLVGGGWNTLFTACAAAVGLYFAGRAMLDAVSVASRRMPDDVRPWLVAIVGTVVLVLGVFVIELPHNAASAAAWIALPGAFALGAYRPGLLPRRLRARGLLVVVLLFLLVPVVGVLGARTDGATNGGPPVVVDGQLDSGHAMVGPLWMAGVNEFHTLFESTHLPFGAESSRYEWVVAEGASLAGLTHLRAEAWHADPDAPWRLDPAHTAPFAVAAVSRHGRTLAAELVTTDDPDVSSWELILTGIGPDGRRYILDYGTGGTSTFTGSTWDWLVAALEDG